MRGGATARCLATAGLLAAAPLARAEGLTLFLEPTFVVADLWSRDQLGRTTSQDSRQLLQSYRLSYDKALGPALQLTSGAMLDDNLERTRQAGRWSSHEATTRALYARLTLGLPTLAGGLSYDLGDARATGVRPLIGETLTGHLRWLPLDLPEVSLRLSRTHQYDSSRSIQDLTTVGALLAARYALDAVETKYSLVWSQPRDAITGTESRSIDQAAQAIYSDRIFEDRTVVYASATLRNQLVHTLVSGSGSITVQQHPLAGLSLIETFPARPEEDALAANPALVDGNLSVGAALDVGYAPALAGDANRRDLGVQFGDLLTSVNTVRVWVDKRLGDEVAAAYTWTAWRSDDNRVWTPVGITGPVVFGPFQTFFEIPIQEVRARYLKVVTQPLSPSVTTEAAYASVLLTELQVFLTTPASQVPRDQASSSALLSLSATTALWRAANLSWDLAATAERRISPTATLWSALNGLSASQQVARTLQLLERLARQDADQGVGHLGQTDWSAGLLWKPLLTFTGSLVYSGQYVDSVPVLDVATGGYVVQGGNLSHALASLVRADLYEGVSMQVNASAGLQHRPDQTDIYNGTLNSTLALTPSPRASLAVGWLATHTRTYAFDGSRSSDTAQRADATLSLRPAPAISAVGSVSRTFTGPRPFTTGTAQINYSPLRGDLRLTLAYSRTFDTLSETTIEAFSPTLRWYLRQNLQLSASYAHLATTTPVSASRSRTLGFGLSLIL